MDTTSASPLAAQRRQRRIKPRFWPEGWWKLMEFRIGIIPLPVYVMLLALIAGFAVTGKVPGEISMAIAVLAFFGFTCAEIGKRLPVIRNIGAAAIFATFIPSALVYYHLLPKPILKLTTEFTKSTNFLYLFIASIIVGSILSMDRQRADQGLHQDLRSARGRLDRGGDRRDAGRHGARARRAPHVLLHRGADHGGRRRRRRDSAVDRLFGDPASAAGRAVRAGAAAGDARQPHRDPAVAGVLDYVGKRYPHLTGEGRLQPARRTRWTRCRRKSRGHVDVTHIAAAGVTAITLYLLGLMCRNLFGLPAPVAMLFLAVLVKLARAVSPPLQEGAFVVYKFFSTAVTYPLLFAIGVAMTPWDKLMAAFTLANIVTIVATVATLMGTGLRGRPLAEDVPDRDGDRQRLPQRPGRHRRRRDPDGGQPHAADAVRADRHAHRRRDRRHADADRARALRMMRRCRRPDARRAYSASGGQCRAHEDPR